MSSIGKFMRNLLRQGAFEGVPPQEANFVRCDLGTTTQDNIENGIFSMLMGFATLEPVEFVILRKGQLALHKLGSWSTSLLKKWTAKPMLSPLQL
jgi:phage tail sheath protein FI